MADVRIEGLEKSYGSVKVLSAIDLNVPDGDFTVLVGPSGCGKSTLLRAISGLEPISGGSIFIGDRDATKLDPVQRGVGMVFQSYALYPHMSVEENIGFGLKIAKRPAAEIRQRVQDVATLLKLDQLLDRKPRALSGGQRQRVAIGRSLARRPDIFLLDEPLSNLDAALRVDMRVELSQLHAELRSTMIYVTHDQVEAMTMADRIVIMNEGRIMQVGTPLELFNRPSNRFVAGFLGQPATNFIKIDRAEVQNQTSIVHFGNNSVTLPGVPAAGIESATTLGLRPGVFATSSESSNISATVDVTEQLGDETLVHASLSSNEKLTIKLKGQHRFKRDEVIDLAAHVKSPMLFDQQGINLFAD